MCWQSKLYQKQKTTTKKKMRQIYKSKQNKAKGRAKYEVKEESMRAGEQEIGLWGCGVGLASLLERLGEEKKKKTK